MAANEAEQLRKRLKNGSGIINIAPEDVNNYGAMDEDEEEDEFDEDDDVNVSSSLNLNPSTFSNMLNRSTNLNMNDDSRELNNTAQENAMDLSSTNGHKEEAVSDENEEEEEAEDPLDAEDVALVINENVNACVNEPHYEVTGDDQNQTSIDSSTMEVSNTTVKKGKKGTSGRRSSRKRSAPKNDDFIDSDAAYSKQRKIDLKIKLKPKTPPKSRSSPRAKVIEQSLESKRLAKTTVQDPVNMTNDVVSDTAATKTDMEGDVDASTTVEPTLEGFKKYPFGEECGITRCTYRVSGSHWHCEEPNCSFGLNDRSRAAAHTQKHAQVKAMLGEDFEHYSAKSNCNRPDCEHAMSSAHFHCKKCAYITTITNKVQVMTCYLYICFRSLNYKEFFALNVIIIITICIMQQLTHS